MELKGNKTPIKKIAERFSIKCGICTASTKDEGVMYETPRGYLDLCMQCDLDLCMEMMKQLVVDAKVSRGIFMARKEKAIDKMEKRILNANITIQKQN